MKSQFTPNFKDPRTVKRAHQVLNYIALYVSPTKSQNIANSIFLQHLGNTRRGLGAYFYNAMFEITDPYYNPANHIAMSYRLREGSVQKLQADIGITVFRPRVTPELQQQITTGDFEYTSSSDRLFNSIQYIRKQVRTEILNQAGYWHQFDIQSAAVTLVYQHCQALNPKFTGTALLDYITNSHSVRESIAQECSVKPSDVKFVINSVLNGGVISSWQGNKVFAKLDYNRDSIIKLNSNPKLIAIKADITKMWALTRSQFPVVYITDKNGQQRKQRVPGTAKSAVYRSLEKQVGNVIRRQLRKEKTRFLWIHDGWSCDRLLDTNALIAQVRQQTGFVINITKEV